MHARRGNLFRCTAGRRRNQGMAITPTRGRSVPLMEQGKWGDANVGARDAYLLRPTEPESWRAIARLASRTKPMANGTGPEWRKTTDRAHRLLIEDRRDYIAAALAAEEGDAGSKTVDALLAQPTDAAAGDLMWAGQAGVATKRSCSGTRLCRTYWRIKAQNRTQLPLL